MYHISDVLFIIVLSHTIRKINLKQREQFCFCFHVGTQAFSCIVFRHYINYKYFRLVIFLCAFLKFYSVRLVINIAHYNY